MFCQKDHSACAHGKGKAAILIILALVAIAAGVYFRYMQTASQQQTTQDNTMQMTVLQTPRTVAAFQLEHYQQPAYSNQALAGKWTMMFFGFTNCPKLCPNTMAELNKVYGELQQKQIKQLPQVVLVSVDPERDNAQVVADYAKGFNPTFIGVRAEEAQIAALTKELGIAYFKTPLPDAANHEGAHEHQHYDINHSGNIILFNPEGKIAGFFSTPHKADTIASEFIKVSHQA